ncbi:MAG: hypothetical protein QXD50_05485, partial [Desulfurococcaceae archaeon]
FYDNINRNELEQAIKLYRDKYSRLEWNLAFTDELKDLISIEEYNALCNIGQPSSWQNKIVEELEASIYA